MEAILIGGSLAATLARALVWPRRREWWTWWRRQFETCAAYCEREEWLAIRRERMPIVNGKVVSDEIFRREEVQP